MPEGARKRLINLTDREKFLVDAVIRVERGRRPTSNDYLLLWEFYNVLGADIAPRVREILAGGRGTTT